MLSRRDEGFTIPRAFLHNPWKRRVPCEDGGVFDTPQSRNPPDGSAAGADHDHDNWSRFLHNVIVASALGLLVLERRKALKGS
jgi:hypothetical protein